MIKRVVVGIAFLLGTSDSFSQKNWDLKQLEDINISRNFKMDKTLNFVSNTSDVFAIGLPVGLLAAGYIGDNAELKREGFNAATTTFATYGIGFILKKAVDRNRPYLDHPQIKNYKDFSGGSFPSGSTALAFSTATSLSLSYPKWYVIVPSALYASTVGYSRLHLGAHYPSDVLAGAAIGVGTAFASRKLNQWIRNEGKKKKLKNQNLE